MAPPDPAAQMVAPQPNVPRETSAPDPLESQLMALLQQKQSNPVQLYQPPMPRSSNERDVGGRGFLSGLVGGFNSRQAHGADDQQQQIKNALLGIESHRRTTLAQQRLVPGQAGRTPTAMRPPMATKEDPYADLKAQKYQAQIDATKALAERRRRVDTTGKRSGSKSGGGKGAGTYASERAQINALAESEKQRRAASIITMGQGASWSKEQIQAGIARMHAATESERTQMLHALDAKYGVTRAPVDRANDFGVKTGKTEEDIMKDLQP